MSVLEFHLPKLPNYYGADMYGKTPGWSVLEDLKLSSDSEEEEAVDKIRRSHPPVKIVSTKPKRPSPDTTTSTNTAEPNGIEYAANRKSTACPLDFLLPNTGTDHHQATNDKPTTTERSKFHLAHNGQSIKKTRNLTSLPPSKRVPDKTILLKKSHNNAAEYSSKDHQNLSQHRPNQSIGRTHGGNNKMMAGSMGMGNIGQSRPNSAVEIVNLTIVDGNNNKDHQYADVDEKICFYEGPRARVGLRNSVIRRFLLDLYASDAPRIRSFFPPAAPSFSPPPAEAAVIALSDDDKKTKCLQADDSDVVMKERNGCGEGQAMLIQGSRLRNSSHQTSKIDSNGLSKNHHDPRFDHHETKMTAKTDSSKAQQKLTKDHRRQQNDASQIPYHSRHSRRNSRSPSDQLSRKRSQQQHHREDELVDGQKTVKSGPLSRHHQQHHRQQQRSSKSPKRPRGGCTAGNTVADEQRFSSRELMSRKSEEDTNNLKLSLSQLDSSPSHVRNRSDSVGQTLGHKRPAASGKHYTEMSRNLWQRAAKRK